MTQYSLGTVGFEIQNTGGPQATAEINNLANAANTKLSPAVKDVIAQLQFVSRVNKQVAQSTKELTYETAALSAVQLRQATSGLQNYEAALANTRRGMGEMGMATQQVGYQVGDFLVQIQSGTNPLVAFGQQATQLVGILPAFSGALGMSVGSLVALSAGLGIAIPLVTAIGAVFLRTSKNTDTASEALKSYEQVLKNLSTTLSETNLRLEAMRRGLTPDEVFTAILAIEDLQNQFDTLMSTEVSGFWDAFTRGDRMAALTAMRLEMEKTLETLREQAAEEQRVENATRRRANEQRNSFREAREEAESFRDVLLEALGAVTKISTTDLSRPFTNALPAIQGMIDKLKQMPFVGQLYGQAVGQQNLLDRLTAGDDERGSQRTTVAGSRTVMPEQPWLNTGSSGGGSREQESALERLREQLDLERELVGTSEAYQRVRRALGDDFATTSPQIIDNLVQQIERNEELIELEKQREQLMDRVQSSLENGFMAMVEGTQSVKDAFKQMAYEIIKELYRVFVVQRLVNGITGKLSLLGGSSTGSFGLPFGLATGGSMMPNKPYLVGEHGPELVIPRHSGTVVNANQTAGAMSGGGDITVQNNISVTGSDAAMVRAEVAKMIPQITNATKTAVIDARLRGGQMKQAFR